MPIDNGELRFCLRVINETTAKIAICDKSLAQFNAGIVSGIAAALLYTDSIDSDSYDRLTAIALAEASKAIVADAAKPIV